MGKKLKSKPTKIETFDSVKGISFVPTRDIDFTKLIKENIPTVKIERLNKEQVKQVYGSGIEGRYVNMANLYYSEKEKTIAYEQTFSIVATHLRTINEMASIGLPNDVYKVVVEYSLKEINKTLQKHIDKLNENTENIITPTKEGE